MTASTADGRPAVDAGRRGVRPVVVTVAGRRWSLGAGAVARERLRGVGRVEGADG